MNFNFADWHTLSLDRENSLDAHQGFHKYPNDSEDTSEPRGGTAAHLRWTSETPCAMDRVENSICLAAVQREGRALIHVPKQTKVICMAAVQQNGLALLYVHKQSKAVCRAAVKQNPDAIKYVHCLSDL